MRALLQPSPVDSPSRRPSTSVEGSARQHQERSPRSPPAVSRRPGHRPRPLLGPLILRGVTARRGRARTFCAHRSQPSSTSICPGSAQGLRCVDNGTRAVVALTSYREKTAVYGTFYMWAVEASEGPLTHYLAVDASQHATHHVPSIPGPRRDRRSQPVERCHDGGRGQRSSVRLRDAPQVVIPR